MTSRQMRRNPQSPASGAQMFILQSIFQISVSLSVGSFFPDLQLQSSSDFESLAEVAGGDLVVVAGGGLVVMASG